MINDFSGEYAFLSNYYPLPMVYSGISYGSSEAAYQAQKTIDESIQRKFAILSPDAAKRMGKSVHLRPDWERVKDDIMYHICLAKFTQHPDYAQKLIDTGDEELVEGNTWHDTHFGVCDGVGDNVLGKILMRIRQELSTHV